MSKYKKLLNISCRICETNFPTGKQLSNHVLKTHDISSKNYTVSYIYNNIKPLCVICGQETRYVAFTYKRYCKAHCKNAEIEAGKIGGVIKQTWNKGKTKLTDYRLADYSLNITGKNNHFFGKHHSDNAINKISKNKTLISDEFIKRILLRDKDFTLLTDINDYKSRQKQYLVVRCNFCKIEQQKTLQAFERGSRCLVCNPVSKSNHELEIFSYVRNLCSDTISGDRSIISPKELDVYVPSKQLAIEYNGLYWHSDGNRDENFDKKNHIKKLDFATSKNIKLLQFFTDEWRDKEEICKSIISHKLGTTKQKIHARKCKLIELSSQQQQNFFNISHISGSVPCRKAFGLLYNEKIIGALSLRTPRQKQKYQNLFEIARYATSPHTHIHGGLSKLITHAIKWCKTQNALGIMTYVDKRFGDGKGYKCCKFQYIGSTVVDFWYTDNIIRYDRFKYRAQHQTSEKLFALNANVSRIYGCGSYIMKLEF